MKPRDKEDKASVGTPGSPVNQDTPPSSRLGLHLLMQEWLDCLPLYPHSNRRQRKLGELGHSSFFQGHFLEVIPTNASYIELAST